MIQNHFYRIFVAFFICMMFGLSTSFAMDKNDIIKLYSQGNEFFRQANEIGKSQQAKELYNKAVMRYERIVKEGNIKNGKLFYNIGNTYFRMGDIGRAILNYRRAQYFIPNDPNLYQNLAYARSRRFDKIEEKQQTKMLKTLLFWHYDLSSKIRSTIFIVCFGLLWLGASVRLFYKKTIHLWYLVCIGFVAFLFLSSLLFEITMENRNKVGVILVEEIIGRKGDSEAYQPSFKEPLHSGTEFNLVEKREKWIHIELNDGRRCWITSKVAEFV
jgi:tetratricopeptide (TPR) repeat protein